MVVSTLTALAAAGLFALTTNLQRAAASSVPSVGTGPLHLLRRLVTDRRWLLGGLIGAAALALHAVALARGSVMVVQSVMALGLVVALAVEARREGRAMHAHELAGAALVVAGVAAVVAVSRAADPGATTGPGAVVAAVLVALVTLGAILRSRHQVGERWGARLLAAAGGACFAVDAVFLQRVAALFDHGVGSAFTSGVAALSAAGDLAGFFGASMIGTVAIHRAYQVAPLRAVQPALAAAEPVTAFAVGVTVLHEGVQGGMLGFVVLVLGLVAITTGIFVGLLPASTAVAAVPVVPVVPVGSAVPVGSVPVGSAPVGSVPVGSARPARAPRPQVVGGAVSIAVPLTRPVGAAGSVGVPIRMPIRMPAAVPVATAVAGPAEVSRAAHVGQPPPRVWISRDTAIPLRALAR